MGVITSLHFSYLTLVMLEAEAFILWLKDNGALISTKIGIKNYSDEGAGLGVVALEDIKVNGLDFTTSASPTFLLLER